MTGSVLQSWFLTYIIRENCRQFEIEAGIQYDLYCCKQWSPNVIAVSTLTYSRCLSCWHAINVYAMLQHLFKEEYPPPHLSHTHSHEPWILEHKNVLPCSFCSPSSKGSDSGPAAGFFPSHCPSTSPGVLACVSVSPTNYWQCCGRHREPSEQVLWAVDHLRCYQWWGFQKQVKLPKNSEGRYEET